MGNLTSNQNKAIEALLTGCTHVAAAAAAGVSSRTLSRWKDDPGFSKALKQRGRVALAGATTRLKASVDTAVDVLQDVMQDGETPAAVRVRAAVAVIDGALKLAEVTDIMERLDALEAAINAK